MTSLHMSHLWYQWPLCLGPTTKMPSSCNSNDVVMEGPLACGVSLVHTILWSFCSPLLSFNLMHALSQHKMEHLLHSPFKLTHYYVFGQIKCGKWVKKMNNDSKDPHTHRKPKISIIAYYNIVKNKNEKLLEYTWASKYSALLVTSTNSCGE